MYDTYRGEETTMGTGEPHEVSDGVLVYKSFVIGKFGRWCLYIDYVYAYIVDS